MSGIITLTMNPALDKSTVTRIVSPDRKLRCERPLREPGGGGINVSRALRRLGTESVAFFLGGGPTGDILSGLLKEEGVEPRMLPTSEWTRENLMVREEGEGDHQYRFDMPGPELSVKEWKGCLEELEALDPAPDFLVASGSLPPGAPSDFYARIADLGQKVGANVVLDTSRDALRLGLTDGVYMVKPNLRELAELTGEDLETEIREGEREGRSHSDFEKDMVEAARKLIARGKARVVVVSMGSAGALMVMKDDAQKVQTPTVPIRSRVGAGDSMVAGIVHGLERGMEVETAVRLGVAAGAAAVMTPGSELCRPGDVEALYQTVSASPRFRFSENSTPRE
jgi:6-phosphofructokinase 2